jgi:hypothetical protein
MKKSLFAVGCALIAVGIWAGAPVNALGQVTFTGSQTNNELSASVTFSLLNGTNLQVKLTDTYTGDTPDQSHVLTGVFFSGATGLTPVSATAGAGSVEWIGTTSYAAPGSAVLGTEWGYATGSGAPGGAASGIVSAGYWNAVGMGNFASPGDMLDGSSYGLLSAGYAGSDLDGLDDRQYIQDSMVFVLSGFTGSLANISDVSFQYGTSFGGEPNIPAVVVPEPRALLPGAILIAAAWAVSRRKFGIGGAS